MSISLATDVTPGKHRNPTLDEQMRKIQQAVNGLLRDVHVEQTRIILVNTGITTADFWIPADATAGNLLLNLPKSSDATHSVGIMKVDAGANTVTVAASGTETINGAATIVLAAQYDKAILVSNQQGLWYRFV